MASGVKIGLTGGIGCGKSSVAKLFRARGFQSLDSDLIVHDLLARDAETIAEVVAVFGPEARRSAGGIDRALLGRIVFEDPKLLSALEGILHPRVRKTWQAACLEGENWVLEIPLLFEKKLEKNVDITVCVFSHPETQVERLEQRGMNRTQALARMNRQMPLSEKAKLADYVLLNDGSFEFLEEQLDCLISSLNNLH